MSEALVNHAVGAPSNGLPIWRRSAFAAEFGDAFISDTDLEGGTCADGVCQWSPPPAVTFSRDQSTHNVLQRLRISGKWQREPCQVKGPKCNG